MANTNASTILTSPGAIPLTRSQVPQGRLKIARRFIDSEYSFFAERGGKKTLLPIGVIRDLDANPKMITGDFHIVGGNVDSKTGEDLPNVPSKMGVSPCKCASNETDYGKNWKPKSEEEVDRRKGYITDPNDQLQDLVVSLKRLKMTESCYCCPGLK